MARQLTPGERHMIGSVFPAGTIALDQVSLVKNKNFDPDMIGNYAYVSRDNRINFANPGAYFRCWYSEDFSKENNFFYRTLLIHEIAHIWQDQAQVPSDDDFDDFAIDDAVRDYDVNSHTQKHLDLHKIATPAGALAVKGMHLEFHKPLADFQAAMVNAYITLRGSLNVDHVTAQDLRQNWMQRRNYNSGAHDLGQTLFWEMNHEEQAEVIVDYFCLVHGRSPEMERYMVSTHKRPPIEVYRKIIPFL